MEATSPVESVAYIGETAGTVWRVLSENGPMSVTRLLKAVEEPRDTVMQALGWLARENKVSIEDEGRTRIVSLAE